MGPLLPPLEKRDMPPEPDTGRSNGEGIVKYWCGIFKSLCLATPEDLLDVPSRADLPPSIGLVLAEKS